jgi:negative regulator of flagellin synthesis FlgM
MVDSIGMKTGAAVMRLVPVNAVNKVQGTDKVAGAETVVQTAATGLTREMAMKPPVDAERVAKIKKAIEDGNFPLIPSTIADRLIALKLEWNPNDKA